MTTSKTSIPNVVKCDNPITNIHSSLSQDIINSNPKSNEKETQQIIHNNEKKSNEEKIQPTIINNDKKIDEEKTQEQIIQPVISEISDKSSTTTPINLKQANKVFELMDVESKIDSSNESSDDIDEPPESKFALMINDFIDSD